MNRYGRVLTGLMGFCVLISSCKLDQPVVPGDPGYVATPNPGTNTASVTGTVVTGTTVNNGNLSATWKTATTTKQFIDPNNVVVSSSLDNNFFSTVTLNESAKTANYADLTTGESTETYVLSLTGGILYMQLSADPFSRSVNSQIQITNLTATAMTWLAVDPKIVSAGGQLLRNAYLVTFTK